MNGGLLLVMLYTLVVGIPLELHRSRGMYGGLLARFVLMVFFTIGIYATGRRRLLRCAVRDSNRVGPSSNGS